MWNFVRFSRPSLERQCVVFTEAAVVSPFNSTAKLRHTMPVKHSFEFTSLRKIEAFRFEDENDYEYEIYLKVFSRILKKKTPKV